jgi:mRNA interferase MazF
MGWRGAVVLANLDPTIGSEQSGRRPVLVVSNEDANQILPNVTVLPLTSTQRQLYPSEVLLPAGIAGQPRDSIAMAHQIRTISKQRLEQIYGYLRDHELQDLVRRAIDEHLDL